MRAIIIEDELPASRQLQRMLKKLEPGMEIVAQLESIEAATAWLQEGLPVDLAFADIELADGLSFEIFQKVQVSFPVIFTTAYDQYALRAFKANSIDYLLKPIVQKELEAALNRYQSWFERQTVPPGLSQNLLEEISRQVLQPAHRERFLVKQGSQLAVLPVDQIAYCYSDEGVTFARTPANKRYQLDFTLDQLEDQLPQKQFYRINRRLLLSFSCIRQIHTFFNQRLKLELNPSPDFEVIVSRERVGGFKAWLDR